LKYSVRRFCVLINYLKTWIYKSVLSLPKGSPRAALKWKSGHPELVAGKLE